jgi:uncharacterized protein
MFNGFIFSIGELLKAEQGKQIKFNFKGKHILSKAVKGEIIFMRIDEGIHVLLKNVELYTELECVKCLEKYNQYINIAQTERVYFFEKQTNEEDKFDTFYVDMKSLTIDITEFLRQEIILHFPLIPVCSKSCKGLCINCGMNLNKGECKCKNEVELIKPLSNLKDLIVN